VYIGYHKVLVDVPGWNRLFIKKKNKQTNKKTKNKAEQKKTKQKKQANKLRKNNTY